MSNSKMLQTKVTVASYRMDERLDRGRIVHHTTYPATERTSLIIEALDYGYDVQFVQAKHADSHHILWYSTNGFSQR